MRKTLLMIGLTAIFVVVLDIMVAATLSWASNNGKLQSLVQYFEFGRSVPGKLTQWEESPGMPGNLYDVAWRSQSVMHSQQAFKEEKAAQGPVVRSYGMSFVNNIMRHAVDIKNEIKWDAHAGPGAPPNYTFALFQDDRNARRLGDVAVFGILSSSVSSMAALSNSTWAFEQPAPFTYPVFWPEAAGLRRVEPAINSAAELRGLTDEDRQIWEAQLRQEDFFFGAHTFGLTWLDYSPFARLVRRALATSRIEQTEAEILAGDYPYEQVLRLMVGEFARAARADGQIPVVMLIQSRSPTDPNVLEIVKPVLDLDSIPYLATAEHFDPRDASGFLSDGHYAARVDRLFAKHFLYVLEKAQAIDFNHFTSGSE